jgi:MHS family proline/betaine transporter-like MFS transporter
MNEAQRSCDGHTEKLRMTAATMDKSPSDVRRWRAVAAASIGNALEWFDFIIYGFFAAVMARLFFPTGNETASLMVSLAAFGVPFFMRPLGAIVIGNYADRYGRKAAFTLTIRLMMLGTAIIAVAPTYATAGLFAPFLIVFARLIQGFSAGGEFGSATAFLAEQDPKRRGFFASWQFASQGITTILATAVGVTLLSSLTTAQMDSWGWRIPFIIGLLIGPVAWYIRRHVDETIEFKTMKVSDSPVREAFSGGTRQLLVALGAAAVFVLAVTLNQPTEVAKFILTWPFILTAVFGFLGAALLGSLQPRILVALGVVALCTVSMYTVVLFMPTYAARQFGLTTSVGFYGSMLVGLIQLVLIPVFGALSDRHGRLPFAFVSAAAMLVVFYPLFSWLAAVPTLQTLLIVQGIIGVLMAGYMGPLGALMADLLPARMRTTGLAVSYAFGVAIFGGLAPLFNTWIIEVTKNNLAPAFYLMLAAAISLLALTFARRFGVR